MLLQSVVCPPFFYDKFCPLLNVLQPLWPPCHSQITSWMFLPRILCTCPSSREALISQTVTKLSCISFRSCLKCHLIKEALPDLFKITACWLHFLLLSIYFALLYYFYSTNHVLIHSNFACLFTVCFLFYLLCSLQYLHCLGKCTCRCQINISFLERGLTYCY